MTPIARLKRGQKGGSIRAASWGSSGDFLLQYLFSPPLLQEYGYARQRVCPKAIDRGGGSAGFEKIHLARDLGFLAVENSRKRLRLEQQFGADERGRRQEQKSVSDGAKRMSQEPYSLRRIFHPIGQGAFYSETHRIGDGPTTTVVYDCGSKTSKTKIKESIDENLHDNRVTILFISHFHSDHCNGIKFLNPKYIVLPMLSEYEKLLLWIENTLNESELDMNYERTLRDRFPESRFIYVREINDEEEVEGEPLNLEDFLGEYIASGTPLQIGRTSSWDYIPINPKLDSALIEEFKQRLVEKEIDYARLCAFDYAYFNTCKEELQKIYREIRSPNEYSMAVYSGPGIPYHDFWERTLRYWNESCLSFTHIGRYPQRGNGPFCGCLYLGDMNLKEGGNTKSKILKKIYSLLPDTVFDCLSTIQVPHHGSFENFNNALLSWYDKSRDSWKPWYGPMLYVISAGDPNQYHHPSPRVLEKLINHHIVTQHPESRLIESFRFF